MSQLSDTATALTSVTTALGTIATAIGVGVAGRQLLLAQRLSVMQFEDQLSAQYRALMKELPVGAPLGDGLSETEHEKALGTFVHYFDLSNEQAFLNERGRVSDEVWASWKEGIEQNLRRPAFEYAWSEVAARAPDSFDHLRAIVKPTMTTPSVAGLVAVQGNAPT